MQRPSLHVRDWLFTVEQGFAQAPQLATFVSSGTSQPSSVDPARGPLQSPKPLRQACTHLPAEHVCEPLFSVEHAALHAPQWAVLVERLTSQPLAAVLSQFEKPVLQANPHCPAMHVRVAFARVGQTLPHEPQWAGSVWVSVQVPEQLVWLPPQPATHEPPAHTLFEMQALLHSPQWLGLLVVSTHALPHREKPALQLKPHCPALHVRVAFGTLGQATPQAPQLSTSVDVLTHLSVHLTKSALQEKPHWPPLQVGEAFAGAEHRRPQPPQ
jgi:hypothetical protein